MGFNGHTMEYITYLGGAVDVTFGFITMVIKPISWDIAPIAMVVYPFISGTAPPSWFRWIGMRMSQPWKSI
jgi:hypothetical protein